MHIFSYLDLKSLRLCMRVCKRFNNICKDGHFYRELNLKVSIIFAWKIICKINVVFSILALLVYIFLFYANFF